MASQTKSPRRGFLIRAGAMLAILAAPLAGVGGASRLARATEQWWRPGTVDALTAIRTRRSIRAFTPEPVDPALVREIIAAATSAPSARNEQPWHFVVLEDRDDLKKVAQRDTMPAVGLLLCAEMRLVKAPGFWPQDMAACAQSLLLAARALGLGAGWNGIYPDEARMKLFREVAALPEGVIPFSYHPVGHARHYPDPEDRYRPERIHQGKW